MSIDYGHRRAWLRQRTLLGINDGNLDLGRHPAFSKMPDVRAAVVLLPADPLATLLDFNGDVPDAIPQQLSGQASKIGGSALHQTVVSGSHVLRVSTDPQGGARLLAGVARHGGAVAGGGDGCAYKRDGYLAYRLSVLTGLVRIALQTQVALNGMSVGAGVREGPFELVVALPGATGALLGAFAPGWRNLEEGLDDPPLCVEEHPVVRLEIESLPSDPNGVTPLLTQAMSRVVNLFGTDAPLYANSHQQTAGVPRDY